MLITVFWDQLSAQLKIKQFDQLKFEILANPIAQIQAEHRVYLKK